MNAPADFYSRLLRSPSAARAGRAMFARAWSKLAPPPPLMIAEWAERHRIVSSEESALPGRWSFRFSPAIRGILDAFHEPGVYKIVGQKSAQIAWTSGVVCNVMGYHVDHRPSVQVAVFPRLQAAKDFAAEKFDPMVRACPRLRARINLKSRAHGNSQTRKHFAGGLIKLVGGNSPSDVKSTSGRVVIIEEPDDVSGDVKGQGAAIKLAEERGKTYRDQGLVILIGGTPSVKGASAIDMEMGVSDKRKGYVPCHHCGEEHVLEWDNVVIPEDPESPMHEVFGHHQPARAYYACPHCGGIWNDDQRVANIQRMRWVPTAPFTGVVGFYLSELISVFDGSRLPILAEKYLRAKHEAEGGDFGALIAFTNQCLGLPWDYKGDLPAEEDLRARALNYPELTVPEGAWEITCGVDVQHDRLAVSLWAWGPGEESWLIYWGELYGQIIIPLAGAWLELDAFLDRRIAHACGSTLKIAVAAIDTGDGQTSDAAYAFVRARRGRGPKVIACKGWNDNEGRREIWSPPKPIDANHSNTKAYKYGIQVHMVGAARAKDLILGHDKAAGRIRLEGHGAGRMHTYSGVRADFYEQLLSEIKIPSRADPRKRVWFPRADRRQEGLDTTILALYAARLLKLHLRKPADWIAVEHQVRQRALFDAGAEYSVSEVRGPGQAPPVPDEAPASPRVPAAVTSQPGLAGGGAITLDGWARR